MTNHAIDLFAYVRVVVYVCVVAYAYVCVVAYVRVAFVPEYQSYVMTNHAIDPFA